MVALRLVAPGTQLREGLDRILQARMGALIVVGDGPEVLSVCSGGFLLDAEFTPQRLSELAKMDGAIILASDTSRVARANVHLVPDPNVPTSENGTRHRTAERVGRQLDVPVITASEDMSLVAIHRRGEKHTLEPIPRVLARADQALQILGRYKSRLDAVSGSLSALEVEDLVTVRDVATVLQRAEMVRRIAEEIEGYVIELGADGRMVMLQLEELVGGVEEYRRVAAARLPPLAQDPAPARTGVRPRRRPLLQPAEDHAGGRRRPHRGRGRGRSAGEGNQGGPVPARRDLDSREVRLRWPSCRPDRTRSTSSTSC